MTSRPSTVDRSAGPVNSGRAAALALFVVLAVLATGGILYFFFGRTGVVAPPSDPPRAFAPSPGARRDSPVEATKVSHEPTRPEAGVESDRALSAADSIVLRGRVIAAESGEPLRRAVVRHLAVSAGALDAVSNDGYLVAETAAADHFGATSEIGRALASSSHAVTGDDGTYELTAETRGGGEIVVHAPGHALERRALTGDSSATNDFALAKAAAVSGTVRDAETGEPAANMSVIAAPDAARTGFAGLVPSRSDPRGLSGPDGRFALVGLPPGARRVVPRTGKSDYVGLSLKQGREVVGREGETVDGVDFVVNRGGRVRGAVSDAVGAAIPGVTLTALAADALSASMRGDLEPYVSATETRTTSDDLGRFEIRGLPLGKVLAVLASGEGYAPTRVETRPLTAAEPEAIVDVTLGRGSDLSGLVLDAAGSPAPGAKVTITPSMADLLGGNSLAMASERPRLEAMADDDGRFRFSNLPKGEYSIRAGEVNAYDTFDQARLGVTVALDGIAAIEGVEVRLIAAAAGTGPGVIAGIVKDDRGEPIDGASVKLEPEGGGFLSFLGPSGDASATSRKDGTFRARGLDPEKTYTVSATHDGHAKASLSAVTPGLAPLEIVLTRTASVSGIVLTSDGAPAPVPFTVRAEPVSDGSPENAIQELMPEALRQKTARTAAGAKDGTFTLADVEPGTIEIVAEVPGFAPARTAEIGLAAGDALTDVSIRISVGATLRGAVTLSDGSPIRMATVTARAVKENDGADVLRRMMPQFARAGARDATTGDDGRFQIQHLAAGRYALVAEHPEYASSREAIVFLEADESKSAPALVLSAGGTIEGTAVDGPSGKGIAGLLVQVMGDGPMQMTSTDADGKFRIERLGAGGYLLNLVDAAAMLSGKGMRMKGKPVEIASDEVVRVDFVFGVGAKIRGRVSGNFAKNGMQVVTLRRPGGPGPEAIDPLDFDKQMEAARFQGGVGFVASDGTYAIEDVEPGTYVLELPVLPDNPLDFASYANLDRTPKFRREVKVEEKDLEIDIFVP